MARWTAGEFGAESREVNGLARRLQSTCRPVLLSVQDREDENKVQWKQKRVRQRQTNMYAYRHYAGPGAVPHTMHMLG